jgi:hypothetical protein
MFSDKKSEEACQLIKYIFQIQSFEIVPTTKKREKELKFINIYSQTDLHILNK